ncbi:TniQ family protein [Thalassomonas viridans]|uniref:TniQ family protein n=1 Tax=Thalassomonas viridans TaxID=137584 RepID=A0AAF0C7L6_9GAMM|nr:TnsD family Tn7-like transposition protein [Thalassomonas viridans]WDE05427.1 TniQ family protein [Thalassomonas viridans]
MLGFPLPYRDELLYSVIARYGVHQGIISPKELLDEVYSDRKVVATVDLPGHIEHIAGLYPNRPDTGPLELIYSHTLFPLYAPFVDEARRQACIKYMKQQTKGSTHLTLGVAASRIKQPRWLRYCPLCLREQKEKIGEYYWLRHWQVAGADSCLLHGSLIDSNTLRHPEHKHEFTAATLRTCNPDISQQPGSTQSCFITRGVYELLQLKPEFSPTFQQWSHFYKSLLFNAGLNRGEHINYNLLKEKVTDCWGSRWLKKYGLYPEDKETCWLKSIFRKHRKAFSYLEHLVIWYSLLDEGWQVSDILEQVNSQPKEQKAVSTTLLGASDKDKAKYRNLWLTAAEKHGVNYARKHKSGHVYAWLYRHDRGWLLQTNIRLQAPNVIKNPRIDWHKRDRSLVKLLCSIKNAAECRLDDPRHSMNWYLSKLYCGSTVTKHLNDLPLCKLFFDRFCETIAEYQIRRITRAAIEQSLLGNQLKRWQIFRMSGLSEPRLTKLADSFLVKVVRL